MSELGSHAGCCLVVIGSYSDHTILDAQRLISLLSLWRFNRLGMCINFDALFSSSCSASGSAAPETISRSKRLEFVQTHLIVSTKEGKRS